VLLQIKDKCGMIQFKKASISQMVGAFLGFRTSFPIKAKILLYENNRRTIWGTFCQIFGLETEPINSKSAWHYPTDNLPSHQSVNTKKYLNHLKRPKKRLKYCG
jgi:hypothetical protein